MKKIRWKMGIAFGIGAVMLLASGLSAMAGTSGYDAYKSALKNNISAVSITNSGRISVTDNGTKVLEADIVAKINREQNAMSVSATFDNGANKQAFHVFKEENKIVFKKDDDNIYRQLSLGESKWKHRGEKRSGPPKQVESIVDALMGNMKEMATVRESSDGGKSASLHLSGSQIPAVVNALGSLAASNAADCGRWNNSEADPHALGDMKANFPKLTENIKIQQIHLDAEINRDNYLEHQKGEIIVTGTDDSGIDHKLVISLDFNLSGFNQTVPETIDLTGKQVEIIQQKERNPRWQH